MEKAEASATTVINEKTETAESAPATADNGTHEDVDKW